MKIREFFKRLDKKTKLTIASFAALAAVAVPAAVIAGYGPNGPDRVIYDWSNPAQREGAFDAPRFNSYINTPVYGDERAFVDAKECVVTGPQCYTQGQSGGYSDQTQVQVGKEYIVRAYIHNDAHPSINGANRDGVGVARNTKFRLQIPEGIANGFTLNGTISADNAIPRSVYDTVDLRNNNQLFDVEYIPGSAFISNAATPQGRQLSDDIVGPNGTLIGYDNMNGIYPGCFEFSAFITIRVKITAPELDVQKRVSKVDMPKLTDSSESINVKRGDTISWRLDYKNTGSGVIDNVTIRDQIPTGLTLVPNSIVLSTAAGNETLKDTALSSGGVDVGDYFPNGNGVIRFRTKVDTNREVCEIVNTVYGRADKLPERSDTAKIIIEDCQPTSPQYRCDAIHKELVNGRTFKFTTDATANGGATIKQYRYEFNGSAYKADGLSNKTKGELTHTFPNSPNSFTAKVTVDFTVDGKDQSHTDKTCELTIDFEGPKELPNTGAGSIVGIFAATTIAGALAHRYIYGRK